MQIGSVNAIPDARDRWREMRSSAVDAHHGQSIVVGPHRFSLPFQALAYTSRILTVNWVTPGSGGSG
jgi:hypothetical protein